MAFESCGTLLLMESITQKFADLIFFRLMRDTSPRAKLRLTTTIVPDLPRRSFHTPWGASSKFLKPSLARILSQMSLLSSTG